MARVFSPMRECILGTGATAPGVLAIAGCLFVGGLGVGVSARVSEAAATRLKQSETVIASGIDNPDLIYPGQVLTIPD